MSILEDSDHLLKTPDLEQQRSAMGTAEIAVKMFQTRKKLDRDCIDP